MSNNKKCTKPNCDCVEIAEQNNNGNPVKSYPCLNGACDADQEKQPLKGIEPVKEEKPNKFIVGQQYVCTLQLSTGTYEVTDVILEYRHKFNIWVGDIKYKGISGDWTNRKGSFHFNSTVDKYSTHLPPTDAVENKEERGIDGVTQNFGKNNGIMPCPYCNEPEGANVILGYKYPRYRITCIPCNILMEHDRKDKVIGFWNNRLYHTQTQQSKLVEVIEAEIKEQKEHIEFYGKDSEHSYCSIVLTDLLTKIKE